MGAKRNAGICAAAAFAASGCADLNLGRFAPPGVVKYEDIAGDQPPSEEIQSRIAERKAAGEAKTPRLSEQPQLRPDAMPVAERNTIVGALHEQRDALNDAVVDDRFAAADERLTAEEARTIEEIAEDLEKAIQRDKADIAKERREMERAERRKKREGRR